MYRGGDEVHVDPSDSAPRQPVHLDEAEDVVVGDDGYLRQSAEIP